MPSWWLLAQVYMASMLYANQLRLLMHMCMCECVCQWREVYCASLIHGGHELRKYALRQSLARIVVDGKTQA